MRAWMVVSLLVFVAVATAVAFHLSADFLPARHLDLEGSWFAKVDERVARLRVVVQHVPTEAIVETAERTLDDGTFELNVRTGTRPAGAPGHDGTVVIEMELPASTPAVLVLDRRWAHARDHPQGLRLERLPEVPSEQP